MKIKKIESQAPSPHLTQDQLAKRWGKAVITLAKWRERGWGPRFLKLGHHVRYPLSEVEAWEQKQIRRSTVG